MYNGSDIFKLVDTYGLPLDIINLMLREKGEVFNCEEFILAGIKGGWTGERITQTLVAAAKPDTDLVGLKQRIEDVIRRTWLQTIR